MKLINIKEIVKNTEIELKNAEAIVNRNFISAFEWGYVEDLYKSKYKLEYVKHFEDITHDNFVEQVKKDIFDLIPLRSSTSEGNNRANILRLNVLKRLLDDAVWYTVLTNKSEENK